MKHLLALVLCGTALLCPFGHATAQGTAADYRRAYSLYERFGAHQILGRAEQQTWCNATTFAYSTLTAEGRTYHLGTVNADNATLHTVNTRALTEALSRELKREVDGTRLWLERLGTKGEGMESLTFVYDGHHWQFDAPCSDSPALIRLRPVEPRRRNGRQRHWMEVDDERMGGPVLSPDGRMRAYSKNDTGDVRVADGKTDRPLSLAGPAGHYYSAYIQWSPDGRYVCANRIRPAQKRYVHYVESSPRHQLQPVLHKQEYAKPGDELRSKVPCVFEVGTARAIIPSTELFARQYELRGPVWNADSRALTFEYNERGHKVFRVLELDVTKGTVRTLVEESSPTFVNYNRYYRHTLRDGRHMLWLSERDNWAHLYLYDLKDGKVKRQITRGEWVVRSVLHVDEERNHIYFTASGREPGEDPYQVHYYRIDLDGRNLTCLTPGNGEHEAKFNADFSLLLDTYSRPDCPPVTVLRRTDRPADSLVVSCADISRLLEAGWQAPEVFTAPGRDGKTPMWGLIWRPTNFDPTRRYPVIEYIYAGPGSAYTPKSFSAYNHNTTALAELGFIVVQLDGMGTSHRGKRFEDVCYKNLHDAGFPDRIEWMRAAARRYPYMDVERVGIFGASAGGQEAMAAVLHHPHFYKAAYSSCGCHDNRMDKIWWNEQWMGYPVDSSYVAASNVAQAHRLTRPLMLVVGELDDNVDPASTMQVVDALIRANKDFELVVLPGVGHTMGERYGEHKRFDFFVRHLYRTTPPAWNELQ